MTTLISGDTEQIAFRARRKYGSPLQAVKHVRVYNTLTYKYIYIYIIKYYVVFVVVFLMFVFYSTILADTYVTKVAHIRVETKHIFEMALTYIFNHVSKHFVAKG